MPPRGRHRHHNSVEETSFALTLPLSLRLLFVAFCFFFLLRRTRRRFLLLIAVNGARASSTLESGDSANTSQEEGENNRGYHESLRKLASNGIVTLAHIGFLVFLKKICLFLYDKL